MYRIYLWNRVTHLLQQFSTRNLSLLHPDNSYIIVLCLNLNWVEYTYTIHILLFYYQYELLFFLIKLFNVFIMLLLSYCTYVFPPKMGVSEGESEGQTNINGSWSRKYKFAIAELPYIIRNYFSLHFLKYSPNRKMFQIRIVDQWNIYI
jgi:hypothetical protein